MVLLSGITDGTNPIGSYFGFLVGRQVRAEFNVLSAHDMTPRLESACSAL
jgi:hypothetical protein